MHAGWILLLVALLLTLLGVETIDTTRPSTATRQLMLGCVGFVFSNRLRLVTCAATATSKLVVISSWIDFIDISGNSGST